MENDRQMKTQSAASGSPRRTSYKRWAAAGVAALIGMAGLGAATAQNRDFGCGMMGGPGMMRGHMMGGPSMMGGEFLERRLGYILDAIKATPEQATKIKDILSKAREDMTNTRKGFLDTRDQFAEILGAATIDRDAAEKLRADRFQAMEEASKKHLGTLLDAAEVLTPEQRAQLLQHFKERRAFQR